MRRPSGPLFSLLLINFIGSLGFSIVLPILIYIVRKFGGGELMYGLLGAVYPAFQLIGAPLLGSWSDRYGRKRILLLSQAGTLAAWCIFLLAFYLPRNVGIPLPGAFASASVLSLALLTLFLARALDGLTGGNVAVANAYLADISEASDRKRHYGWMTAAGSIGMIAGPALSGLLGGTALAEKLPILAAVVISALALGIIARFLPERGQPARPAVRLGRLRLRLGRSGRRQPGYSAGRRTNPRRQRARRVWAQPAVRYILIMYFLMFLGFNVFYTAFPVHAAETLAWSPLRLGLFFSVLSGVLAFVEGPVLGALARRFSDEQLVIAGGLILASNFLLLLSPALPLVYASAVLFALGNGLMWPSFLSVLSKTASEQYQGTVQGLAGSAGSIASIVGLILGGLLYRYLGPATFGVAAGLMFGFWLLSWRLPSLRPGAPLA